MNKKLIALVGCLALGGVALAGPANGPQPTLDRHHHHHHRHWCPPPPPPPPPCHHHGWYPPPPPPPPPVRYWR